jgi:glycine dehydrogenase subunit 1
MESVTSRYFTKRVSDFMDFVSNQKPQLEKMLKAIGVSDVDALFASIPPHLKCAPILRDDGLSEYEGMRHMEALASKNTYPFLDNYLGAGSYEHHVPPLVQAICSKSEFLTAYTPYQPEASQGMLQSIFEYQSAICALTGMEVSNASLYDGASACAEALLMSLRTQKGKNHILIAETLHPHYRAVVEQYLECQDVVIETIPFDVDGSLNLDFLQQHLSDQTAAVLLSYPNFFGVIDPIEKVSSLVKKVGALLVLSANPLVYGLYRSAGELEVDIAVGDCQPFGLPLQFGGPYAGYIACRQSLIRQLPGRIVGETVDKEGRRGFVLTLQAREQHIRREKATSNICTNQALAALSSLIALLWYGKKGVAALAKGNYQRANYLRNELKKLSMVSLFSEASHFNEFVIEFKEPLETLLPRFRRAGIEPGLPLSRYFPSFQNHLLVAVTETKSKKHLDRYLEVIKHG